MAPCSPSKGYQLDIRCILRQIGIFCCFSEGFSHSPQLIRYLLCIRKLRDSSDPKFSFCRGPWRHGKSRTEMCNVCTRVAAHQFAWSTFFLPFSFWFDTWSKHGWRFRHCDQNKTGSTVIGLSPDDFINELGCCSSPTRRVFGTHEFAASISWIEMKLVHKSRIVEPGPHSDSVC